MPKPHELLDLYQQRTEEIKSIEHIFVYLNNSYNGGDVKGTRYSFILWGNGQITWYNDGCVSSFEEVFNNVPIDIKNELIFHLDLFK